MKKYLAEMIGTMVLVLMGCGSAVFIGGCGTPAQVLTVACAFGLSVVAMAYAIGGISGCHINPAITLGVWISGRMNGKDALCYMLFQVIGAFIGSAILYALTSTIDMTYATETGANVTNSVSGGLIAEIVRIGCSRLYRFRKRSRQHGRTCYWTYFGFGTHSLYSHHGHIGKPCKKYSSCSV